MSLSKKHGVPTLLCYIWIRYWWLYETTNMRTADLEAYVLQQFEGVSVEAQVEQHLGVVHVVGQLGWRREVAEWHHLFGAVDDHGVIDVGPTRLGLLLQKITWDPDKEGHFQLQNHIALGTLATLKCFPIKLYTGLCCSTVVNLTKSWRLEAF